MANAGQVIADKYEILKLIGHGGMSNVYLARDMRLNKQWAVKEIPKKARDKNNELVVQSAIAEANMIKQLDHPSIVRIVDVIDNPDVIYIIEDYIEGEPLNTILEDNGAQPQELVIRWAMQICEALEYLHTREPAIIYRDMKPSNVMLKPDGNIKIIDFGIAREYKEQNSADTINLGTKGYAAPEQFGGKGQTDARTDVYCLGVTLYHLVTGHSPCDPPYEIYPIRHWNPQLDPGLEAIIGKCTQLNPQDRYQSCAELLYALHHYKENGAAYRAKQKKKLATFIIMAAACLLFAIVGVLGLAMRTHTNNEDYGRILNSARNSPDAQAVDLYYQAIEIKPNEIFPYIKITDIYGVDNEFTLDEEKRLLPVVTNPQLPSLLGDEAYGQLAFKIGKLYWYHYAYGTTLKSEDATPDSQNKSEDATSDSQNESENGNKYIKMTNAIVWFKDAAEKLESGSDKKMAEIYADIGTFHKSIDKHSVEAEDGGMYIKYWKDLEVLVNTLLSGNKTENEIVDLEVCNLVMNSIKIYAGKFEKEGVSQVDMTSLFTRVNSVVTKANPTDTKTIELKRSLTELSDSVNEAIIKAYRE